MNDVLNTQGYTQAAWWNRTPVAAWVLMVLIAACANVLVGYGARGLKAGAGLLLIVPLVVSLSFMLVADIDSPRGGVIRAKPLNLHALANSIVRIEPVLTHNAPRERNTHVRYRTDHRQLQYRSRS